MALLNLSREPTIAHEVIAFFKKIGYKEGTLEKLIENSLCQNAPISLLAANAHARTAFVNACILKPAAMCSHAAAQKAASDSP